MSSVSNSAGDKDRSDKQLDVVGFGNALVDVLSHQNNEFLERINVAKGAMHLIDSERSAELYSLITERKTVSGGSAANTVIGVGSLGGSAGFIGRVADDDLGDIFAKDMAKLKIFYNTPRAPREDSTGRCLIFVTPDGERTLNTFLGASNGLTTSDVDLGLVQRAKILFLEGYLWDLPWAKQAMEAAASAVNLNTKVALTLSDSFCVDRHRDSFLNLISDHVDVLLANDHEILSLFETEDLSLAIQRATSIVSLASVTKGPTGSVIASDSEIVSLEAANVCEVVDKTGAGDLYAAGLLYGLAQGYPLERCGKLGAIAAGEVISHMGPRPETNLRQLVGELA